MRLCEIEAKKILAAHDIPIPKGKLATSKTAGKTRRYRQCCPFLASPESDYISGQVIAVDGGTLSVHPHTVPPLYS